MFGHCCVCYFYWHQFCTPSCQWLHLSCRHVCTRGDVCGRKARSVVVCLIVVTIAKDTFMSSVGRLDLDRCGLIADRGILVGHKTEPVILYSIVLLCPSPRLCYCTNMSVPEMVGWVWPPDALTEHSYQSAQGPGLDRFVGTGALVNTSSLPKQEDMWCARTPVGPLMLLSPLALPVPVARNTY